MDKKGNALVEFLKIEEWKELVTELKIDIPQWQKQILDQRLSTDREGVEELGTHLDSLKLKRRAPL